MWDIEYRILGVESRAVVSWDSTWIAEGHGPNRVPEYACLQGRSVTRAAR